MYIYLYDSFTYLLTYLCICTEQSRRDDLEATGYILVYFLKGSLPWQGIKCADKRQKNDLILQRKNETSTESLCSGLPGMYSNSYLSKLALEYIWLIFVQQVVVDICSYIHRLMYTYICTHWYCYSCFSCLFWPCPIARVRRQTGLRVSAPTLPWALSAQRLLVRLSVRLVTIDSRDGVSICQCQCHRARSRYWFEPLWHVSLSHP